MHFSTLFSTVTVVLVGMADISSAHCVFIDAWGSAKPAIHGYGLGFGAFTPRKGTHLVPHQRDVAVFDQRVVHNSWNKNYLPNGCGCTAQTVAVHYEKTNKTLWKKKGKWLFSEITPAGGFVNVKNHIEYMSVLEHQKKTRKCLATGRTGLLSGIPKVAAGKLLTIAVYQVNLDGAGPYSCKIDFKGRGATWTRPLNVVSCKVNGKHVGKQCPGDKYSFNWGTIGKVMSFQVQLPANLNCQGTYGAKGGIKDICVVRCENKAQNGPFGGCVPIQQIRPGVKPTKPKVVVTSKKVQSIKTVGGKRQTVTVVQRVTVTKPAGPAGPRPTKKVVTTRRIVRVPVVKVIKVTPKVPVRPPPPRTRVIIATQRTIVYIIRGGKRTPTTLTKGATVTVTETLTPTVSVVTTTVTETQTYEDEVTEPTAGAGGDGDAGGKGGEPGEEKVDEEDEVEDEPEDKSNDIGGKSEEPATKTPTEDEIEAAIGGEDIDDEERERLKNEKISGEGKEFLNEAEENKEEEFDNTGDDTGYF